MFETFFLQTIFNAPVFILNNIFIYTIIWMVFKKIGSISIEREKTTKKIEFFINIDQIISKTDRPLIIFPQATRVLPNDRPPFKKGAARIYKELNINCLPVAINSGHVWPKIGEKKTNRIITISILKPIKPGLNKEKFLKTLEESIYSELDFIR